MSHSNRIMMLFSILGRGKAKQYMQMLSSKGMMFHLQLTAHGTAPSEMMDIFGLGNTDKDVVLTFASEPLVNSYAEDITKNVGSSSEYGGLMMCLRLSAVNRLAAEIVNRQNRENTEKGEVKKMANMHKQQLILITVNQGFTEQVMQTAKPQAPWAAPSCEPALPPPMPPSR